MTLHQNPVAQPLGPVSISGTQITVDSLVNPASRIPAIIRSLVAANEGYFAETIFNSPGWTVEGGAVIYAETFPETNFFLPADQSFAPRAPGAEAARLGSTRPEEKVALPESWAGSIEVNDEARRRNKVLSVQTQFTQAANSLADIMQRRAIETLMAAITTWERSAEALNKWDAEIESGVANADPTTLPMADLAAMQQVFIEDKVGVAPDTIILNPTDNTNLVVTYASWPMGGLDAMLRDFGITRRIVTPHAEEGNAIYVKAGQVGTIAHEAPFSQEQERDAETKSDLYVLEATPVFVAHDASAVWMQTEVS